MRLTLRHDYDFGADRELVGTDLLRPDAWDALRTRTDGPFALAGDREAWIANALGDRELGRRARDVNELLDESGALSVASYGVGTGALEYGIWTARPDRELTLTDFGPATVRGLEAVFPEVPVQRHDLLRDGPLEADSHLFHRVDTELDDDQWRDLLRRSAGRRLLVAATEVLTAGDVALRLASRLRSRNATHAGWARTRGRFEELWAETHEARRVTIGELSGWDLRPRGAT